MYYQPAQQPAGGFSPMAMIIVLVILLIAGLAYYELSKPSTTNPASSNSSGNNSSGNNSSGNTSSGNADALLPDKDICVAFSGSDGINRNQIFFNRLCTGGDAEMIRSGWTPEFKFNAYSDYVPNSKKYCIGFRGDPNRSVIMKLDNCNTLYNSGWQDNGHFYAYDQQKPGMDSYCVKTTNSPGYRMQMWKNMEPCNDSGNGWTPAFQFWLPK